MAPYTVVDGGYDVEVFKSFTALWKSVSQCPRLTDGDSPLWADDSESVNLTKAGLRKELDEQGCARAFEAGHYDWTIKVKKQ